MIGPPSETEPHSPGSFADNLPNGTSHFLSPVFASIAITVPHGGGVQGRCFGLNNIRRIMP